MRRDDPQMAQSTSPLQSNEITSTVKKDETHYTILGVCKEDDLATIKAAHRSLALQCHPDKQQPTDPKDNSQERFLKIQKAWECLRDADARKLYDDSLDRTMEQNQTRIDKAKPVLLSEMTCEVCDVEIDLDEDESNGGQIDDCPSPAVEQQNVYSLPCRCGYEFEILEDELMFDSCPNRNEVNFGDGEPTNIWECQNCSLTIRVIKD